MEKLRNREVGVFNFKNGLEFQIKDLKLSTLYNKKELSNYYDISWLLCTEEHKMWDPALAIFGNKLGIMSMWGGVDIINYQLEIDLKYTINFKINPKGDWKLSINDKEFEGRRTDFTLDRESAYFVFGVGQEKVKTPGNKLVGFFEDYYIKEFR